MSTPDDSDPTTDAEPVESVDRDEADVLLADPDDYHQAQRLRQIHRARQNVHDTYREIQRFATGSDHNRQKMDLADAVTAYIAELEPLMNATDNVPDFDYDKAPWEDVLDYATNIGWKTDEDNKSQEMATYGESMRIFRYCNEFLAEVKPLVEPDETDEWEV